MNALAAALAGGLAPALRLWLARRARRGKEDPARLAERRGIASLPRPAGRLLWIHGASVGEARSALPLLGRILDAFPAAHALVTTGTLASARMLAEALPARAMHQFVPLDVPAWAGRFLDHWRPDAALWIESELWPSTLAALARRGVPAALVNARLSPSSFARWQGLGAMLRPPLDAFGVVLAQSAADATRLAALGARAPACLGNIKFDAPLLPVDDAALAALRSALAGRPRWLAASTHPGEDEVVAQAHRAAERAHPGLLTILVPRHAARGAEVAARLRAAGLVVARRGAGEAVARDTQVYLADTMGELGLFYRLAPLAFIGKSFAVGGGQNPIEAAALDVAILSGPMVANFADVFGQLAEAGGARILADPAELGPAVAALVADEDARARMAAEAAAVAASGRGALARVMDALAPVLAPLAEGGADART
jgi:3-deoxy-D-manno-octulosonic-acid transferase